MAGIFDWFTSSSSPQPIGSLGSWYTGPRYESGLGNTFGLNVSDGEEEQSLQNMLLGGGLGDNSSALNLMRLNALSTGNPLGVNVAFNSNNMTPKLENALINNLSNRNLWQGIGTMGGLLLNGFGMMNALQNAKFQKNAFNKNYGIIRNNMTNNLISYNTQLRDRMAARAMAQTGNPDAYNDRARSMYLRDIDGTTPGVNE